MERNMVLQSVGRPVVEVQTRQWFAQIVTPGGDTPDSVADVCLGSYPACSGEVSWAREKAQSLCPEGCWIISVGFDGYDEF